MTQKPTNSQAHRQKVPGAQRLQWPVFESIKQAAAVLHYTEAEIKLAKNTGSRAFISGGRIDSGILVPDLNDILHQAKELPDGFTSWKEFGESRRALQADIDLQKMRGETMATADAVRQAGEAGGHTMSELERLCRELPPALAGQDSVSVFKRLSAEVERIRKTLTEKFNQIGKQK